MPISDIARIRLAFIEESAFGVQETGSNLQVMRITSESLKQNTDIVASREIRDDRQTAGIARTRVAAGGNIDFELSYASFDDFILAALIASAWSSPQTIVATETVPAATMVCGLDQADAISAARMKSSKLA